MRSRVHRMDDRERAPYGNATGRNPDAIVAEAPIGIGESGMTRLGTSFAALVASATSVCAQVSSEYTTFDVETDCAVIARSTDGEGDWAELVCAGFANYPFVIRYGDVRESITYGFGSGAGMTTMAPFNNANDTIEWRVRQDRGGTYPFAAIQRWFVAHPEGREEDEQVLVVSRVGQPSDGKACVVAYLKASGDASANERAREIADGAAKFACGDDRPVIDDELSGLVPVP